MISLLGSLLGFGTSFMPNVLGFFEKKQANKQELLMLEAKAKYASELSKLKLQEIDAQADIEEAKALPAPPEPEISRMEYDMKDQLIRQTIMTTQDDVKEIKEQMIRMEDKIDQLK